MGRTCLAKGGRDDEGEVKSTPAARSSCHHGNLRVMSALGGRFCPKEKRGGLGWEGDIPDGSVEKEINTFSTFCQFCGFFENHKFEIVIEFPCF